MLLSRVKEHGQPSRNTSICEHIQSCDQYQLKAKHTKYKDTPNPKLAHLKSHFEVLQGGLSNYNKRKDMEGLMITLLKPKLNDQVKHRNVTII